MRKTVSICIPCYNEQNNVKPMAEAVKQEMKKVPEVDYEILFADNASTDQTQEVLKTIAAEDRRVKVIINNRNFGARRSLLNCIRHTKGDAVICFVCDFQTPIDLISEFVRSWQQGNRVIFGQKIKSKENKIKYLLRTVYYKIISKCSDVKQYEHAAGISIYDRSVIDELNQVSGNEPISYAHMVAELGYEVKLIPYIQEKRKSGKTSFNFWRYLDFSISSLTSTSTVPLRLATILGCITSSISFICGVIYLVFKLIHWSTFSAGMAPIVIGVFFLGSVQLLSIGMLGEYISVVLRKLSKVPLVIEKEMINFD